MKLAFSSFFMALALAVSSVRADEAAFDGTVEDWPTPTTIAIGTNLVLKTTTSSDKEWSVTTDKEGYLDAKVVTNADGTATLTLTPLYAYDKWPLTVKYGSTTLKEFEIDIPAEEHAISLQAGETFTTNVVFFKETTWSVTGGKYVTATSAASGKAASTVVTINAGSVSTNGDVTVSRVNSQGTATPMHVYHVTVTGGEEPPEHAAGFTVTPYVQRPATNAMTVLFFTDEDCAATVRCWPADEADGVVTQTLTATCAAATDLGVKNATDDVLRWEEQYKHRVRFEGLTPGTRYAYEVRLGEPEGAGPVYANFFRTAPGRDTPVRFIAYSDSETIPPTYSDSSADSAGCTTEWDVLEGGKNVVKTYHVSRSEGFASNLVHMAAWEPDLYLVAGDLVARGGVQMFWDEYWKENAGGLGLGYNDPAGSVPILATLGNHDLYDNVGYSALKYQYNSNGEKGLAKFLSYFEFNSNGVDYASSSAGSEQDSRDKSQLFHREDYGPVTLIFLDTNDSSGISGARAPSFAQGSLQYQWLEANLKDARDVRKSRFTFVVNHHCPYSRGKHNKPSDAQSAAPVRTQLTPLLMKYGVTGWLCGHDEMQEHAQVVGEAELADGSKRPHVLNVYDLGSAGDGLKGQHVYTDNDPYMVFSAYDDSPDGTHYGHLRVEVAPSNGVWQCTLTPVYSYVTSSHSSELRAYKDKIVINEDGSVAYEEWLVPESEADVTVDSLYVGRSQDVTTTGNAASWSCEVSDERYLSAAVTRKSNGSATVTVTGLAETAEEQTVRVYASAGTAGAPMLVKVITVRAVVALPPEPAAEEGIAVSIDAGLSSNIVTTTAADSWFCKVPSGMSNYVTATATRQADGTATISISAKYAYGSPIAVDVYAHSDVYGKDYLVKTITVTVVGEIEEIPASEGTTNITEATAGAVQTVTTAGAATHWNCKCVEKSDVDWAACIEATVVRNADGTATVTVLPKGAYGGKLTVEVYAGSTVPGEGTLIKTITISKIVAATVAIRLKEGETFVTNCTFGVAHPWSCSTDKSGAYVTASVTTAEATETTLTIVGKAAGTETVTVKRTNGSYTTDAYKFAVTVEEAPSESDPEPSPDDADETIVLAPGATTNLVTASVAAKWNCKPGSSQVTATVTRQSDGTAMLKLTGASSYAEDGVEANVVTVGLYRGSSTAGSGTLLKTVTVRLGEAITLERGGEPVTRNLSYDSTRTWLVGWDADAAVVTAALSEPTKASSSSGYNVETTNRVKKVALTLTGKAPGEERVVIARKNNSPSLMGIYYVTVVTGEPTPYELLRAAFEAGTGTYALETDVECPADESLALAAGKSLVLDLNGHSLTCHRDGAIANAGGLTIIDSEASDFLAAHVTFSEDELDAGYSLVRNAAGARLTVDGVYVDAGFVSEDDYEFSCANTAVSAEGGTVVVTSGGHLGGLCGIEARGDCAITVEKGASVSGTSWRGTGGRQLATAVLFASGTSVLTVRNATLDSEGWLVRSLAGSAASVSVTDSILWSQRASAPFDLSSGTSVAIADSSYADLSVTKVPTVTALANDGADLAIGAGCLLTVGGEDVIGFLKAGVAVEASGVRTWRTVACAAGEWTAISQALGAETEFTHEPAISFVTLEALPTAKGHDLTVRVAVRDGEDIRKVDPAKVAAFVEATSDLSDWTAGKLDATVKSAVRNDDNTMDITLGIASSASAAFVRIVVE